MTQELLTTAQMLFDQKEHTLSPQQKNTFRRAVSDYIADNTQRVVGYASNCLYEIGGELEDREAEADEITEALAEVVEELNQGNLSGRDAVKLLDNANHKITALTGNAERGTLGLLDSYDRQIEHHVFAIENPLESTERLLRKFPALGLPSWPVI